MAASYHGEWDERTMAAGHGMRRVESFYPREEAALRTPSLTVPKQGFHRGASSHAALSAYHSSPHRLPGAAARVTYFRRRCPPKIC